MKISTRLLSGFLCFMVTAFCCSCQKQDVTLLSKISTAIRKPEAGVCILVPGWMTQDADYSSELANIVETLNKHTKGVQFRGNVLLWESHFNGEFTTYGPAAENTEKASLELYEMILELSEEERENLVLVGHSLGCRVIAKTMEKLASGNLKIRQAVFFAAAVPDEKEFVDPLTQNSRLPVLNIIHPQDGALMTAIVAEPLAEYGLDLMDMDRYAEVCKNWYNLRYTPMLGLGSALECENLTEILTAPNLLEHSGGIWETPLNFASYLPNHDFVNYLEAWEFYLSSGQPPVDDLLIAQDFPNLKMKARMNFIWSVLETYEGWQLQQNRITGHCRILNPESYRFAFGKKERMVRSFTKMKIQLDEKIKLRGWTSEK